MNRTFFDTSFLVPAFIDLGDTSVHPQRLMDVVAEGSVEGPSTAWHCCLEFYSVATRLPPEFRLDPEGVLRLLEEEILARFEVDDLPTRTRRRFLRQCREERVMGGRVYDAHIAEIARLGGAAAVVTENRRHFIGLLRHGVRVQTSREFLDALS